MRVHLGKQTYKEHYVNRECIARISPSTKCEQSLENEDMEGGSHKITERINNYSY